MLKSNTENYDWQCNSEFKFTNPVQFTNCKTATQLYNAAIALGELGEEIARQKFAKSIVGFTKDMNDNYRNMIVKRRETEQFIHDLIKASIE